MYRQLWIDIDLGALRRNLDRIKHIVDKKTKIMATVKQEAYGHGLVRIAKELALKGVDFFGVGSLEEGITLRKEGIKQPILVLTAVMPQFVEEFIRYRITPLVVDINFASRLNRCAKAKNIRLPVHIKVDTGMGRIGPWYKDIIKFIDSLKVLRNIFIEGLATHFPSADVDKQFTKQQIDIFNQLISQLKNEGVEFKYIHCANSCGIVNYPQSHFNLVRPGILLYGIKPSANLKIDVEPILSLKSRVVFIKRVEKGRSISYGRTFITSKSCYIATVSVGYADGYPWALSNRGKVIVSHRLFDVVGRVCMDHIMVNLKDTSSVKVGDEVVLIGRNKDLEVKVENIANWVGTIPYEIVTHLSLKIPRFYKNSLQEKNSSYAYKGES
ncbi:MAG: alanine racemase [Candidatus Omnitrophica bacterium]|nr:alanine racemase [Candidatus Omnitrophota bacterium]